MRFISKITTKEITAFTRQLATLAVSGIPLLQSLNIIYKGENNRVLGKIIQGILFSIEKGCSLTVSLGNYPRYFNELYRSLILAGERSGTLDVMLNRITSYQEKNELLVAKIKKALSYPLAIIIVATLITIFLLIFIVPQFQVLFSGLGVPLPPTTVLIIQISNFLQTHGWMLFMLGSVFVTGFILILKRSVTFSKKINSVILHLPLFGRLLKKAILVRFARTLATTFAAGLPLQEALQITSGVTGNPIYQSAILKIRDSIKRGQALHLSLPKELFPNLLIQMVAIGEESGTLETMLFKIAEIYEKEVDQTVEGLSSLLEPFIMIFLGLLIGGLVIAMYLPIFKLGFVVQ